MPHPETAVDGDDGTRDVPGVVAREPRDDPGDLARATRTAPSGMLFLYSACCASDSSSVMSVSMKPGATTFAVMFRAPSSRVSERAMPTRPAFDDE